MLDYKKTEGPHTFRQSFTTALTISLISVFATYFVTHYDFQNLFLVISLFQFIIAFANSRYTRGFSGVIHEFSESRFVRGYASGSLMGMIIVFLLAKILNIW